MYTVRYHRHNSNQFQRRQVRRYSAAQSRARDRSILRNSMRPEAMETVGTGVREAERNMLVST